MSLDSIIAALDRGIERARRRPARVRVVADGQNFGVCGQVLADDGEVLHWTETYPIDSRFSAERDALDWMESRGKLAESGER